jgi:glucans biosynthesis protein C
MHQTQPHTDRLTELDWVRIFAFVLLIAYHVGMFYVPWDWHVKSPHPLPALEPWMQMSSPWRMSLLFVVSGAAMGLMLSRGSVGASLRVRSRRLLMPLLLGMVLIVPPQPYLEVVEKLGYSGSYLEFLGRYFRADHSFCRGTDCLVLPTWNHLWFLPYLWLYTACLLGACRLWGVAWLRSPRWARLCSGTRLLWLPSLVFALVQMLLVRPFPITHNLIWDWFNHTLSGLMFLLGLGLFGHADDRHGAWAAALRWRWWALGVSVLLLWGMPWSLSALGGWDALSAGGQQAWFAMGGAQRWLPVVAVLGFARRHLRHRDGRWRRILTEAVLPAYVVHQTLIVLAAHHLAKLGWPQGLEVGAVLMLTISGCVATCLAAQQWRGLRPWFGMPARRDSGV